jgi:hypothetical protein
MDVRDQLQDPATSHVRIICINCIGESNTNVNNCDVIYSVKYHSIKLVAKLFPERADQ